MGTTCFQRAELDLHFNQNRQLSSSEVSGGDLVTEADYQAWVASQAERRGRAAPSDSTGVS